MEDKLLAAETFATAGQYDQAAEIYEGMLEGAADAMGLLLHNLVPLYVKMRKPARALAAAQALTYFHPAEVRSWMILSSIQEKLGLQEASLASVYRALELDPSDSSAHETRLYLLSAKLHPNDYRVAAEEWYSGLPSITPQSYSCSSRPTSSGRRLRVGYVSGDFRTHVMDRNILPLLEFHNREKFDIFCFDNSATQDKVSTQMRAFPDVTWRYIYGLRDEAIAQQVVDAEIDVLVDLSGLTAGNRLGVFRRKPAPTQLTGIGYLPTTGADCFDYRIADVEIQDQYSEKLWKLPTASAPITLGSGLPISPLPFWKNGYVTFGYLNGLRKLTPTFISTCVSILKAVPKSKLLLMIPGAADSETAASIVRRFDPVQERILLTESQGGNAFCRIFESVDICLDPVPYGGCITTFDTLYHGVPIVGAQSDRRINADAERLQGQAPWTRMAPVEAAIFLSRNTKILEATRKQSRQNLLSHPAGNPQKWVQSLEKAYEQMVTRVASRELEAA